VKNKQLTIGRLAKILNDMVEQGQGRRPVSVFKDTLDTGNDTFNLCEIVKAEIELINICDGDGFHVENKDGSERMRSELVLRGRWWDATSGIDLLERLADKAEKEAKATREQIAMLKKQQERLTK